MKPREFMTFGALCFRVGDSEGEMTIKKGTSRKANFFCLIID